MHICFIAEVIISRLIQAIFFAEKQLAEEDVNMAGVNPRSLNVIRAYKNINVFIMKNGQGRRAGFLWNRCCVLTSKQKRAHNILEKKRSVC